MDETLIADYLSDPDRFLDATQLAWLEPLSPTATALSRVLYGANLATMRSLFRLRVEGLHHLPKQRPFIVAPNHASTLDPFALATALPFAVIRQTCWAGRREAVLRNWLRRSVNRLARVIPIGHTMQAVAAGAAALRSGNNLVWFPEGTRSPTKELQPFKPGIGILMNHFRVPAVPVFLDNTFENLPRDTYWPRHFFPITVHFGEPVEPEPSKGMDTSPVDAADRTAAEVRDEVRDAKHFHD